MCAYLYLCMVGGMLAVSFFLPWFDRMVILYGDITYIHIYIYVCVLCIDWLQYVNIARRLLCAQSFCLR